MHHWLLFGCLLWSLLLKTLQQSGIVGLGSGVDCCSNRTIICRSVLVTVAIPLGQGGWAFLLPVIAKSLACFVGLSL